MTLGRAALWAALLGALAGCDRQRLDTAVEDAAPSPNASILPAPLATAPPGLGPSPGAAGKAFDGDGAQGRSVDASSASPEPLRGDLPAPPDALTAKETAGVSLAGEWRWTDVPGPPKAPEVHAEGLLAARKLTAFKWLVTATEAGRMRIVLDARAFPLPLGSELRARGDRFGHVLVFPGGTEYRSVAPGALRALLGDRRLDVIPLMPGEIEPKGGGPARLGLPVRRFSVSSRMGTLSLDLARVPEAGLGAALLCRTLVELLSVDPAASLCARDELPLRAQFTWPNGGGLSFEAQDLSRKAEVSIGDVLCPPPFAAFAAQGMPPQPSGVFLTRDEAAALRSRPVDTGPPLPGAPGDGLLARNATDSLRYVLLDGVPLAWVMPSTEQLVLGPPRGRYTLQWRSFLGDAIEPPRPIELPARSAVGEPVDAGAPAPAKSK